ncbi:MAG: cytochrome C oxidase subunit IV family protein [Bacteroidales bacterium]|nr:cytochrome C oxidase subunit IV family protein [Bacteroidales bacterium]
MNTKNTLLWLGLILLMLFNFWLAELSALAGKWTLIVILLVTLFKFLGVVFRFMDLKNAHPGWKVLFIVFILLFAVIAGWV